MYRARRTQLRLGVLALAGLMGCVDAPQPGAVGGVGAECETASDCASALCVARICRDPEAVGDNPDTPEAEPTPDATPEPSPEAEPSPEPLPEPSPEPESNPEPGPSPEPEPEPSSEPEPTPEPEPGVDPDPEPAPVDCSPLEGQAGWRLCLADSQSCGVVFEDGAGCARVCAAAGLVCGEVFENLEGECGPDSQRPALSCATPSGHQSDYCRCVRGDDPDPDPDPEPIPEPEPEPDPAPEPACTEALCPAFPGAEGEGMLSRGGRGGTVCRVTHTNNSGVGSLRECAGAGSGPLTIVFEVGGIIDLTSPLRITRDNLTIAGQTAPGDGIVVRGYQTEIRGNNLIIQHIRFRAGDIRKKTQNRDGFTEDSLTVTGSNIIVDHVSASWGIDECLSAGAEITNLTVQYSIISEGLHRTRLFHGEYDADHQGHSMGGLFKPSVGNGEVSLHHNLFAHNNNRNPAVGVYTDGQSIKADIRNNVIYNCNNNGYVSGGGGEAQVNYIGNYGIDGPTGQNSHLFTGNSGGVEVALYQRDNRLDTARNGRFDGTDRGWSAMGGDFSRASSAFELRPITTQSPEDALEAVLADAGARPWGRDGVDLRVVRDVQQGTGRRIDSQDDVGGWGSIAAGTRVRDADGDGMPDDWERDNGTNPDQADNNGDADRDGYTNLENYLHWAGRPR